MEKWKEVLIKPITTIFQTMQLIDKSSLQFAVVVDEELHLLGTVTDGDIRRGILKGYPLDTPITNVMNPFPVYEEKGRGYFYYNEILTQKNLKQLPIVDSDKRVVDIIFYDHYNNFPRKDNPVILMAGGLGTRLRPLTNNIPKPMLKVGDKPILETIIESYKCFGFRNFILSVNYKKEMIKDYFRDGDLLGVNISYIDEEKKLGTAGALSLLQEYPNNPFFVMNGDILTKIHFDSLLDFHIESKSIATMCVREYEFQVPYGVIHTDNNRLLSIEEKPSHRSFVNAGIYVLNPEVINYIPINTFYDMPELFNNLLNKNLSVSAYPLREYWMDIGKMDDYEKANNEFNEVF